MKINVTLTFDISADQAKELGYVDGRPVREVIKDRTLYAMQEIPWVEEHDITVTLK